MPYSISETIGSLEDVIGSSTLELATGDLLFLRPGYVLLQSLIWNGAPSPDAALAIFSALHVLSVLVTLLFFCLVVRPETFNDCIAATTALACLVGVNSFRENLESYPLNETMIIMAATAYALWAVSGPYRRANDILAVILSILAVSVKEQGLALPVLYIVSRVLGYRGVSNRAIVIIAILLAAYVVLRVVLVGEVPVFKSDVGFLFDKLSAQDAIARFGEFPWPIYAYNILCTALSILFSEPRGGAFLATRDLLAGDVQAWQIIEVVSSTAATVLIFYWGIRTFRTARAPDDPGEWRIFVLFLVAGLGVASVLGFNYTRDRFGGVANLLYAICLFYSLRMVLNEALRLRAARFFTVFVVGLLLFTTLWQLRAAGTIYFVRTMAWHNREEWILKYADVAKNRSDRPNYLRAMQLLYRQGIDPSVPNADLDPPVLKELLGGQGLD